MANPNIATTTSIYGLTVGQSVSTSSTTFLGSVASGYLYKVNTIMACNISASAADVTVTFYDSSAGTTYYIAYTITVPAKTTLVILSKDSAIYLNESDYMNAYASAGSAINLVCSYETIN